MTSPTLYKPACLLTSFSSLFIIQSILLHSTPAPAHSTTTSTKSPHLTTKSMAIFHQFKQVLGLLRGYVPRVIFLRPVVTDISATFKRRPIASALCVAARLVVPLLRSQVARSVSVVRLSTTTHSCCSADEQTLPTTRCEAGIQEDRGANGGG